MEKSGNAPSRLRCFRGVTALILLVTSSLCLVYGLRMQDVSIAMANWRSIIGFHDDKSTAASPEESVPLKTILLWNTFYKSVAFGAGGLGQAPFIEVGCPVTACRLTTDKRLLAKADALVFHARTRTTVPRFRPPHQRYVFFLRESPNHAHDLLKHMSGAFNLTMTYRRDSDLPVPVSLMTPIDGANISEPYDLKFPLANRTRNVAWVVSHCDTPSKRERYVKELQKYIDVDIYGACGKFKGCPKSNQTCFNTSIPSRYKFYLGFENSVCTDYVTEKCFRTLHTEIIPVVYGGTNYTRDTPPHSVINVMDFKSPRQLAEHLLWLGRNETEYLKYFEWKNRYRLMGTIPEGFCKLCQILHQKDAKPKTYSDVYQWWTKGTCRNDAIQNQFNR